jgi:anti-sigma B factor antagonist
MGEEDFEMYRAALGTMTRVPARHAAAVAAEREQPKRLLAGVIVAPRDFDVYTAGAVRCAAIRAIAAGHHSIVFDLDAACRFVDSTALGTLTVVLRRIRAHDGRMAVVCTQEWILRRFEIAGLTEALNIHPTLEDAVASVGQHADA